jgi:hypothetical protein
MDNMKLAGDILKTFGAATTSNGSKLHISLNYFCCMSTAELNTVHTVLQSVQWVPFTVAFSEPGWRVDNPADHYSLIVFLDEASEALMQNWVSSLEKLITGAGGVLSSTRREQQPFHCTLAVVNGSTFPLMTGLEAVNAAIRPHEWTSGFGPVALSVPTINF